jgi:hypothetical protein
MFEIYYRLTKEQLIKRFGYIKWIQCVADTGPYVRHACLRDFGGAGVDLQVLLYNGSAEAVLKHYREVDEVKYKEKKFLPKVDNTSAKDNNIEYTDHSKTIIDDEDGIKKIKLIDFNNEEQDTEWDWQAEFTFDLIHDTLTITKNPNYKEEAHINIKDCVITRQTKFKDLPYEYDLDHPDDDKKILHPLIIC